MIKPLVRWTIGGDIHRAGFDILKKSVRSFISLYKNQFDYVVCYNNFKWEDELKDLNVFLYKQFHCEEMEYKPHGVAWKLYPPRLRENSHEIFIDNDVLFHSKSESIDEFLKSTDLTVISTGVKINYGKYINLVPDFSVPANSGVFGLPPKFPFRYLIKKYQNNDKNRQWEDYFDEQGLVACCLLNHYSNKIIPMSEISFCGLDLFFSTSAYHFAGANKGYLKAWNHFKKNSIKIL